MKVKKNYKSILIAVIVILIFLWAAAGTNTSLSNFLDGIPNIVDYVGRMLPPDVSILDVLIVRVLETIQIAIVGTVFGVIIAFPLSFLAARNIMPIRPIYHTVRAIFDVCRGIHEIVWALLFVSMVGLGPFPGVLALAVHLTGALGKYFSEAIENINPQTLNAIISTGANKIQVILHGVLPEVKSLFTGYIFYYFEHSFRAATILGLVGAGGIGLELINSIKLFKSHEVITIILVMVITVIVIDRIGAYIRKRTIGEIEVIE
jgi:phosphonate transport system permease protein